MRCTSKKKLTALALAAASAIVLCGCGASDFAMAYNVDSFVSSFNVISRQKPGVAEAFASDLCIVTDDVTAGTSVDMSEAGAAVLFDAGRGEVLYAKNAHERMYPASLTKVMTALVALKHGSIDSMLTATESVNITESGAQLLGLKVGDTMTLNQALRYLLLYSPNDVAMMIAENVGGGSVDAFVDLMNEEAKALGATNTHFANPHGLSDESHYTTAYDLYLIMNEAVKYDLFQEIIHLTEYQTTYHDADGKEVTRDVKTTNRLLRGDYQAPGQVTVVGGKTGTTNAAGHCLMLLTRDTGGNPYISVILQSSSTDLLYNEMIDLLDEIQN